ncbi:MAG: serine hydrolase [Eubacterium sp.]|nr:serine hydrolase [Eubacterium sp.]
MNFDGFIDEIKKKDWNIYGVEVYEDLKLTHEWGDTKDTPHEIFSCTKTVLSIAVGIAYDRGLFDLDKNIFDYIPEEIYKKYDSKIIEDLRKLSIRRLLTMSVPGYPFRPEGKSYLDFCFSLPVQDPDNNSFYYCNICPYYVGLALNFAVGEDLWEFIDREIIKPLDIDVDYYYRDPDGYFFGASMMRMTLHEISKLGILLYNKGVYNGKRILSEEYVDMATSVQIENDRYGYGFYIWKYKDGFYISGKWGQHCLVLRDEKLIVTFTGYLPDEAEDVENSMIKHILEE